MSGEHKNLKNFYEEQAKRVNCWHYLHFGFGRNIHKVNLQLSLNYLDLDEINNTSQMFIMDLGCGDGVFTIAIARRSKNTVIGCDISGNRIHRTKEALREVGLRNKTDLVICDATYLPFREGSIQKILCHHVLEHIPKDDSVIQEIARVLEINGALVIGVPNENCPLGKVRSTLWWNKISELFGGGRWAGHINKYSFESFQHKLRQKGLKVINSCGIGLIFPFIPIHYFILSNSGLFRLTNLIGCRFPTLSDSLLFKAVKTTILKKKCME